MTQTDMEETRAINQTSEKWEGCMNMHLLNTVRYDDLLSEGKLRTGRRIKNSRNVTC